MMVPGFPDGKPCPKCIAGWIIIIAVVVIALTWRKNNE